MQELHIMHNDIYTLNKHTHVGLGRKPDTGVSQSIKIYISS